MRVKKRGFRFSSKRLNFNFSNRLSYTLIAILVVAIIGVGVYATAGAIPNPGHSLAELQPCSNGETLVTDSSGKWTCITAASGRTAVYYWSCPVASDNPYKYTLGASGGLTLTPTCTEDHSYYTSVCDNTVDPPVYADCDGVCGASSREVCGDSAVVIQNTLLGYLV